MKIALYFGVLLTALTGSRAVGAPIAEIPEPHYTDLTDANWRENVGSGTWFIEFFSPYCPHCKSFAPTWDAFTRESNASDVTFGRVNCVTDGDLCSQEEIKFYPCLRLYEHGAMKALYEGKREIPLLESFVKDHSEETGEVAEAALVVEEDLKRSVDVLESPPSGMVSSLTPQLLQRIKHTALSHPVFVKYYAPWCGHCKTLAPKWEEVASILKGKVHVFEVDCEGVKSTCAREKINGYPTLVFYGKDADSESVEYKGRRDVASMVQFANKASVSHVIEPISDVKELSSAVEADATIVLFLHSQESSNAQADIKVATALARTMISGPPIYTSVSRDIFDRFGLRPERSYLLVFRRGGVTETPLPHVLDVTAKEGELAKERIFRAAAWLASRKLGLITELSSVNYAEIMDERAKDAPLVGFLLLESGAGADRLLDQFSQEIYRHEQNFLASPGEKADVVWLWVNGDRWFRWVHSIFGISKADMTEPRVMFLDPVTLNYWKYTPDHSLITVDPSATNENVFQLVELIKNGTLKAQSSKSFFAQIGGAIYDVGEILVSPFTYYPLITFFFIAMATIGGWIFVVKRRIASSGVPTYTKME